MLAVLIRAVRKDGMGNSPSRAQTVRRETGSPARRDPGRGHLSPHDQ